MAEYRIYIQKSKAFTYTKKSIEGIMEEKDPISKSNNKEVKGCWGQT